MDVGFFSRVELGEPEGGTCSTGDDEALIEVGEPRGASWLGGEQ